MQNSPTCACFSDANISMEGVDAEANDSEKRRFNSDVFCFAIEWIRLVDIFCVCKHFSKVFWFRSKIR